jgi:hypothetical protein
MQYESGQKYGMKKTVRKINLMFTNITLLLVGLCFFLLNGCCLNTSPTRNAPVKTQPTIPSEAIAYEQAVQWLKEHGYFPRGKFDVISKRSNKRLAWVFLFLEAPRTPGGEFTALVYDNGKIELLPGM